MFYKYDRKKMMYKYYTPQIIILSFLICLFSIVIFWGGYWWGGKSNGIYLERGVYIIHKEEEPFSKDALITMIKSLNIKYPHIVLAQSILETGHWSSIVFKKNNNLFGMKMAGSRIKTAQRTQLNHAYYNSWQESVYDYAFYQCRYLGDLNTESDYFNALDETYSESGDAYSQRLKLIIERENLKELFNK